jgi:hypothetical protein
MTPTMSTSKTAPVPGKRYDAALHLLDRQIVDPDGHAVGNVDDLEVTEKGDGTLVMTALLTGPGALGPRLGGRLGHWTVAVWRRLRADADPQPGRIGATHVTDIDSAVHIDLPVAQLDINGLERWIHDYIIDRFPGATNEPQ